MPRGDVNRVKAGDRAHSPGAADLGDRKEFLPRVAKIPWPLSPSGLLPLVKPSQKLESKKAQKIYALELSFWKQSRWRMDVDLEDKPR